MRRSPLDLVPVPELLKLCRLYDPDFDPTPPADSTVKDGKEYLAARAVELISEHLAAHQQGGGEQCERCGLAGAALELAQILHPSEYGLAPIATVKTHRVFPHLLRSQVEGYARRAKLLWREVATSLPDDGGTTYETPSERARDRVRKQRFTSRWYEPVRTAVPIVEMIPKAAE